MVTPGSEAWRYGAASTMIESPITVTPCPAGGGPVVVVVPPGAGPVPGTEVVGPGRWWGVGRMLVTREPGSAADASTTPNNPSAQTTALTATTPTTTQPTGRSRGHDQ